MAVSLRHTVFLLAVMFVPCVAAGQSSSRNEKPAPRISEEFAAIKMAAWTKAVQTHEAASFDEPARTIASWPRPHVSAVLSRLVARRERLLKERAHPSAGELADLSKVLLRGLSLHTDIAFAERDALSQGSSTSADAAVLLIDGRETKYVDRSYHWVVARQIAAALAPDPGEGPRVLAWYRAIAAALQQLGDYDVVTVHLEAALRLFADDPVLALYQGTLHQTLGDARLQEYTRERRRPAPLVRRLDGTERPERAAPRRPDAPDQPVKRPPASDLRRVPKTSETELEAAEREFRFAVSADPTLHEARIRLAHVLSRLGDDRGAADAVRPALEVPLPPFLEFYAAMLLGRSEEHLGHYQEADDAYARAAARFPDAPSARMGRSRVALAQGRAAEALASLAAVTTAGAPDDGDPWLLYLRRHEPDGAAMLDAWRNTIK